MTSQSFTVKNQPERKPAGLGYFIRNGLPSQYSPENWTYSDDLDSLNELLVIGSTVVWTTGPVLRRAFDFAAEKQEVKQALFVNFKTQTTGGKESSHEFVPQLGSNTKNRVVLNAPSDAFRSTSHLTQRQAEITSESQYDRALVVLLEDLAMVFYVDGRRAVISLPFPVRRATALKYGLVLERSSDTLASSASFPLLLFLSDPIDEFGVIKWESKSRAVSTQDIVLYIDDTVCVTTNGSRISIWSLDFDIAPKESPTNSSRLRRHSSRRSSTMALRKEDLEESPRTNTRADFTASLDRIVSADPDGISMLNEEELRHDANLQWIESMPSTSMSAPRVFRIRQDDHTQWLCIFDKDKQTLTELLLATGDHSVQLRNVASALAVRPLRGFLVECSVLLKPDGSLYIHFPSGLDYPVFLDELVVDILDTRGDQVSYITRSGPQRYVNIDIDIRCQATRLILKVLRAVLHITAYSCIVSHILFLRSSEGCTELDALVVTLFSCFLDPQQAPRAVECSVEAINTDVLVKIALAQKYNAAYLPRIIHPQLLLSLHFANIELELNIHNRAVNQILYASLTQLSYWLGWDRYMQYYLGRYETSLPLALDDALDYVNVPLPAELPPSMAEWATGTLRGQRIRMQTVELLIASVNNKGSKEQQKSRGLSVCPLTLAFAKIYENICSPNIPLSHLLQLMMDNDIDGSMLINAPVALVVPIRDILAFASSYPSTSWSAEMLLYLGRADLAQFVKKRPRILSASQQIVTKNTDEVDAAAHNTTNRAFKHDLDRTARMMHPNDRRLLEVSNMLQTSHTTIVHAEFAETLGYAPYLQC